MSHVSYFNFKDSNSVIIGSSLGKIIVIGGIKIKLDLKVLKVRFRFRVRVYNHFSCICIVALELEGKSYFYLISRNGDGPVVVDPDTSRALDRFSFLFVHSP